MSSDLVAGIVAVALGAAVVVLGWRRKLGDTTQEWLPRFGETAESATAPPVPPDGERERRPLTPRQRRWLAWGYLFLSICNAALAFPWANDRLFHAIIAALFALSAAGVWLRKWPPSARESIS